MDCPMLDIDGAKQHMQNALYWQESYRKRCQYFRINAERWEGKYRIVKHENNQLRKKQTPKP